jgi:hypothetical protein
MYVYIVWWQKNIVRRPRVEIFIDERRETTKMNETPTEGLTHLVAMQHRALLGRGSDALGKCCGWQCLLTDTTLLAEDGSAVAVANKCVCVCVATGFDGPEATANIAETLLLRIFDCLSPDDSLNRRNNIFTQPTLPTQLRRAIYCWASSLCCPAQGGRAFKDIPTRQVPDHAISIVLSCLITYGGAASRLGLQADLNTEDHNGSNC